MYVLHGPLALPLKGKAFNLRDIFCILNMKGKQKKKGLKNPNKDLLPPNGKSEFLISSDFPTTVNIKQGK